ncbi:hypothetical protein SAMN05216357_103145 [Porphyromonadaceae bacterium KH3CP3RA]|nr:hypothetical protein SAMN05216357_103145 [Porphyromonadaceae bacterium KH3CP3RA]
MLCLRGMRYYLCDTYFEKYGKKETLSNTDCIYHYPLDCTGCLYPFICNNNPVHCYLHSDVGGNCFYSCLQKSKKIAVLLTDLIKKHEIFLF